MFRKIKHLAAAASVAAVAATIIVTGTTAGVASARVLNPAGLRGDLAPVVWTGKDLVTAAVSVNNILYAYEQVPGAATWRRQVIEDRAHLAHPFIDHFFPPHRVGVDVAEQHAIFIVLIGTGHV